MSRFLIMLICFAGIINTYGQSGQVVIEVTKVKRSSIITKVQVLGFDDRDSAWRSDLEKNISASIVIPASAKKGKYTAIVRFIISKDGSISDVLCENGPGFGICNTATRIIKKSKKWVP